MWVSFPARPIHLEIAPMMLFALALELVVFVTLIWCLTQSERDLTASLTHLSVREYRVVRMNLWAGRVAIVIVTIAIVITAEGLLP